ncbi:hypothetical protein AAES_48627 [Amazona aestiva]|uniref:Uncharacterized protein n=1 Tax=Amazona aestiva TaxID=12930 RepID=A0A0Q3PTJ7_AMAAE|nr:hypothetical protein AAES_48627 [Amazona aestiva]
MIIVIGGIIVASVLVFIFILLMKYKVYNGHPKAKAPKVTNGCSQTNGAAAKAPDGAASPGIGRTAMDAEGDKAAAFLTPEALP